MRIALVLNTRHADNEFEVEYDPPHTIELIKHGIEATGHEYVFVEADKNFAENIKKENQTLSSTEQRDSEVTAANPMCPPYLKCWIYPTLALTC